MVADDVKATLQPATAGLSLDVAHTVDAADHQPLNPWTRLTSLFSDRTVEPVIARDEVQYLREVGLLQPFTVTLVLAGLSVDGSRFLMRNDVLGPEGKLCARIDSTGGWLDLASRRLVAPPPELLAALGTLARSEDFAELPSSVRA